MIVIDQNSAINSLNESLVPSPYLIDGRTEQDWLYFLAEFGKLINFYNVSNTIEGNWSPFLLKDPVFLMASISKTDYKKLYSIYKSNCTKVLQSVTNDYSISIKSNALEQLFDHLTAVYKIIERWTHYMQNTAAMYDLKNYILHEVKAKFSVDFWAVQAFRQHLYSLFIVTAAHKDFASFNNKIWKGNDDKRPYWQVFGFETENSIFKASEDKIISCLTILTKIGDRLFHFLETIIHHSSNEFKKMSLKKSMFPDTILLRSFINILKIQQEQLNGISQKHLDFYYTDILKQTKLSATADSTFLCAALAKNNTTYNLPDKTLFNAGSDEDGNPILFASQKDVNLNPAVIVSVQTLSYHKHLETSSYNLQLVNTPTSIQKDEDGNIMSWDTFGKPNQKEAPLPMGISFASPMLLLREGQREITLTLHFHSIVDLKLFQDASYYLSTQKDWFEIDKKELKFESVLTSIGFILKITIKLKSSQPAIEPFLINPDGLATDWPMFKILFQNISKPGESPKLFSIGITLDVSDVTSFQLYNDFGELNAKNPFAPFGPIPLLNSSFIMGSNEILSKPLESLRIDMSWDKLPCNFKWYYHEYNNYLNNLYPRPEQATIKSRLGRHFNRKTKEQLEVVLRPKFTNEAFMVNFSLLQEKSWNPFKVEKTKKKKDDPDFMVVENDVIPVHLFDHAHYDHHEPFITGLSSVYRYTKPNPTVLDPHVKNHPTIKPDPNIQKTPLVFTDESSSGFIKMDLVGPEYGFGSEIYPNVITNIALQNGYRIRIKDDNFLKAANIPFVPKIKTFSAHYTAHKTYVFDKPQDYPLQCFLYSPFLTDKIFDHETFHETDETKVNTALVGYSIKNLKKGLPIYPSFDYSGALFIELGDLITNRTLNLYFQLARNIGNTLPDDTVTYFYLADSVWKKMEILSDGTNQFNCSGIIELQIAADCSNTKKVMPGTNNWIAVAVHGNLDSYSKTAFLQTNGFLVQRTGDSYLWSKKTPQINSDTIVNPQNAIPQIASLLQPFASFGGKAAEDKKTRDQRVSNSIKTKNRTITSTDYYTLIAQKYDTVYYSKVVTKKRDNTSTVYLVKKAANANESDAFIPLVTNCLESEIGQFLKKNTSPFTKIKVSNFTLEYVCITAYITAKSGYELGFIKANVNQALKLYLSPWITGSKPQIEIGTALNNAKVTHFIKNIEGVATVGKVSFSSSIHHRVTGSEIHYKKDTLTLKPYGPAVLLVSAPAHNIN